MLPIVEGIFYTKRSINRQPLVYLVVSGLAKKH